jgi:hypothetical protein
LLSSFNACCFDWSFYIQKNDLKRHGINSWAWALNHFIHVGIAQGLQSTPTRIDNTNFDWCYYVEKNQLKDIHNRNEAYSHYVTKGKLLNLEYCKSFNVVILFHLYNLYLMDEFIEKINFFMKNNPSNTYYIKINIPVDDRIFEYAPILNNGACSCNSSYDYILEHTPYHKSLINDKNADVLYAIASYLEQQLQISHERLQVIFSENKGLDVGGFLLLLDQIKRESLDFDFLIKLHTKRFGGSRPGEKFGPNFGTGWRNILTAFLNVKINILLREYECIYSSKLNSEHDGEKYNRGFHALRKKLCNHLQIKMAGNYDFCAGTIFIASHRFYEYMKTWDFLSLFDMLDQSQNGVSYAHVYERLFGYIFKMLRLKTCCIDYYAPDYPVSVVC